ncbi:MAG: biopolymer transporter ExbD [Gammaproteobacteria bacterium]
MARRHSAVEEETEINITPMLDIVFIMLIFFIVTTSFIKETGVEVNKPEATTAIPKPRGNIMIAITASDQIWMDKRPVQLGQIRAMVESALAENPEGTVIVITDKEASTGVLIDLMDQVRLGGVANIAVAAEEGAG